MEFFPVGAFEHSARMTSDPAQIALFRLLFDALRIQTPMDFLVRISMNMSISLRFKSVIEMLVESRKPIHSSRHMLSNLHKNLPGRKPLRSLSRCIAVVSLAFAILLSAYVHTAVTSSLNACQSYTECVTFAYRWGPGSPSNSLCHCISLIDVVRVPTQEEWDHPANVTDKIAHLAMSGSLQVLQIINRNLANFPEELQRCKTLRHM